MFKLLPKKEKNTKNQWSESFKLNFPHQLSSPPAISIIWSTTTHLPYSRKTKFSKIFNKKV